MKVNLVIGNPIEHSQSPRIHTAAYEALGISDQYVFRAERVEASELESVTHRMREGQVHALAVTIPHKQAIMSFLDGIDDVATEIGAVNTVIQRNKDTLVGYNTDWQGLIGALEQVTDIRGKKVAILGTGGSAHAVAYAMQRAGAVITIFGRDNAKTIEISKKFGALPASIEAKPEIASHDVIINATSIGLDSSDNTELLKQDMIDGHHVVFDLVYPRQTALLRNAEQAGAIAISGQEMLLHQAVPQIELMTGLTPEIQVMRQALEAVDA